MSDPSMISLDASKLGEIFKQLQQEYAGSAPRAMQQIAMILVGAVDEEWQTEGHGEWKELAASTLRKRRKHGAGAKILQDTAIAVGSVTPVYDAESAEAYTNVPYMIYHTSDEPRTIIPYRNPFDVPQDEVLDQAADILLTLMTAR